MFTLSRKFSKLKVALEETDHHGKPVQSKWSSNFSLGSAGASGVLSIVGRDKRLFELGVQIERSKGIFSMTNIITFYPRFILFNSHGDTLCYR